jgi:hypothetical protein
MMQVTIDMPKDIAERWRAQCNGNMPRAVLQSVALEAYRQRIIGEGRLQQWLGLPTRLEVHRFLKEYGVPLNITREDLLDDQHTHARLGL